MANIGRGKQNNGTYELNNKKKGMNWKQWNEYKNNEINRNYGKQGFGNGE